MNTTELYAFIFLMTVFIGSIVGALLNNERDHEIEIKAMENGYEQVIEDGTKLWKKSSDPLTNGGAVVE